MVEGETDADGAAAGKSLDATPDINPGSGKSIEMDGHKIYDPEFRPLSSKPDAQYRFSDPFHRPTGNDVYFGENIKTSFFEVRKSITGKSLFIGELKIDNILDLTDSDVLDEMNIDRDILTKKVISGVEQKQVYRYTNKIANQAFDSGYRGILYSSSRTSLENNKALILFSGRYSPEMIKNILDIPIQLGGQ